MAKQRRLGQNLYFEDFAEGDTFHSVGRTITDSDIRTYLGATGTNHENHTNSEYCKQHPLLKDVCAPGVLALGVVDGFLASTLTQFLASSMNYGHDKVRYLKPVYVGDTLSADLTVAQCRVKDDQWGVMKVDTTAVNDRFEPVLFDSHLFIVMRRPADGAAQ